MVLWVDIPRVSLAALEGTEDYEKYEGLEHFYQSDLPWDVRSRQLGDGSLFRHDSLANDRHRISDYFWICRDQNRPKRWRLFRLLMCIVPPLRLCPVHPDMRGRAWLPYYGWRTASDRLRRKVERNFEWPDDCGSPAHSADSGDRMEDEARHRRFVLAKAVASCRDRAIWFAFATEFLIMVSISRRKLEYLKKHWIDLAIILLPLLSFLRSLRVLRLSRLGKLAKLEQLSKMIRIYRLRGLSMRMFRALLVWKCSIACFDFRLKSDESRCSIRLRPRRKNSRNSINSSR